MSKSNTFEAQLLALIFNATGIPDLADNTATTPLTNLYVALHNADPGEAGVQTTHEVAYTGYARVAVARTTGGWTVSGSNPTIVNHVATTLNFPICTALTDTATFFSIGYGASGATEILYSGALTPTIAISAGVTPQVVIAVTED